MAVLCLDQVFVPILVNLAFEDQFGEGKDLSSIELQSH